MGHLVGGDRGGEKPEQYIYERGKRNILWPKSLLIIYNKKYDVQESNLKPSSLESAWLRVVGQTGLTSQLVRSSI